MRHGESSCPLRWCCVMVIAGATGFPLDQVHPQARVGVEWTLNRGWSASQSRTFLCLRGVVAHHQMQLDRLTVLIDGLTLSTG